MENWSRYLRYIAAAALFLVVALVLLLMGIDANAQQKRMTIQANARGTGTQLGRQASVNIIIEQFSTKQDQQALIAAFKQGGHEAMVHVLEKMEPKGRLALTGTVGNDVKYIMELPSDKGRRIRLVTDRNIAFREMYQGTRSKEYSVAAIDLILTPDGKGTGKLLPACKLKMNKKQQLEVEAYQNPWELLNFIVYDK